MPRVAIFVALAAALAGCGSGGHVATNGDSARHSPARSDSFGIPKLGLFSARCHPPAPYSIAFTADPGSATDSVTVRVGRRPPRRRSVDPGETFSLDVAIRKRRVGPDEVFTTPPV